MRQLVNTSSNDVLEAFCNEKGVSTEFAADRNILVDSVIQILEQIQQSESKTLIEDAIHQAAEDAPYSQMIKVQYLIVSLTSVYIYSLIH